jgi:hypothetical protein
MGFGNLGQPISTKRHLLRKDAVDTRFAAPFSYTALRSMRLDYIMPNMTAVLVSINENATPNACSFNRPAPSEQPDDPTWRAMYILRQATAFPGKNTASAARGIDIRSNQGNRHAKGRSDRCQTLSVN